VRVRRRLVRTADGPATGFGAVELAARLSVANFSDPDLPPAGTEGERPRTVVYETTVGANWYLNDFTRLMVNYTVTVPEGRGLPALPVHVFGVRTAVYW
jgi:phosphate-selective porin OprO/OprP